jgi:hypothetical protein
MLVLRGAFDFIIATRLSQPLFIDKFQFFKKFQAPVDRGSTYRIISVNREFEQLFGIDVSIRFTNNL